LSSTTDKATTLLGFGASSIGQTPRDYVQNDVDIRRWSATIDSGEFPTAKGRKTNAGNHMLQDIIERLMCDMRVDAKAVANQHGFELSDVLIAVVAFDRYLTADDAPPNARAL
jgi:oxygen-independent coproporphyrinogen-3 oxidase